MPASMLPGDRSVSVSKSRMLVCCVWLLIALAFAGCGGGSAGSGSGGSGTDTGTGNGGSGGSGSGSGAGSGSTDTAAQLQVSPAQLTVSAQTTDPAPTSLIQLSVQVSSAAAQQTGYYIGAEATYNGIASTSITNSAGFAGLSVTFKLPATLGPGTYSDTITFTGCDDQACTRQISGSPQTVSVTYTVVVGAAKAQIYSITPSSASAGAAAFTLAVSGSNFTSQSEVLWNGSPRTTTYVSANQLTAQISAADVSAAGNYSVTVSDSSAGGSVSSAASFTVTPLGPLALSSISPARVTAGGADFMLTTLGTGFASTSSIAWNGASLPTTYVSSTMLRAKVTATQIANVGVAAITVVGSGSQGTSSPLNLTIAPPTVDAVSYQMNPAHTGAVTFRTLALPSGSVWSVDVGGSPSYALIVGGQVYVTAAVNGNSQLWALNGATGATLWGPIAFSGYVNAAYDSGRLFVVSGSTQRQILSAIDPLTGNSLWSAVVAGGWFVEPPVAADGIVYAINSGSVSAFDEVSGASLWQNGFGGTSGIVAATVDGLYGAAPCTAVDLQPAVGVQLWYSNSGCEGGGGATPVAANGLLYAPDGSAPSSGTVFDAQTGAVKGSYSADVIPAFSSTAGFFLSGGTLRGLALSNNQVLWSFAGDGQLSTAPIVVNNYVFVGSQSGHLYALDASTGQQMWNQNLGAALPPSDEYGNPLYTGLAAGDGLLIVPNGTKVTAFVLSTSP